MQSHSISIQKNCRAKTGIQRNFFVWVVSLVVFSLIVVLVVFPDRFMPSVLEGLLLFTNAVLPSLLPFLFLTKILTDLGLVEKLSKCFNKFFEKVFRVPGITAYVFLMSALCGYPVGVKLIADMKNIGVITQKQAEKILPFASTSGPLFVVGSVGFAMFGDKRFGVFIFLCHILGTLLSAFFLGLLGRNKKGKIEEKTFSKPISVSFDKLLSDSAFSSVSSVLLVGCFITLFFLFIDILTSFSLLIPVEFVFEKVLKILNIPSSFTTGLSSGIVELTRGCRDISLLKTSRHSLICVSILVSWGGLSVFAQSSTFLHSAEIKMKSFLVSKVFQTIFTLLVSLCFSMLF